VQQSYDQAHQQATQALQNFLSRTEELLQTLNDQGVESTNVLRERVAVGLEGVQGQLDEAIEATEDASRSATTWLRQNPWTALAIGAVAGVAIRATMSMGGRFMRSA
jgi:ElaB/YqjD/DUF883 family membrane-anchored ribosome-binding protein